jgi:GTP cyclohydrolase I
MPTPPPDRARAARAIDDFLSAIGRDPNAPDLAGTGARVAAMFIDELCAGYAVDPVSILEANVISSHDRSFLEVVVRDIEVTTACPHHLLPASGRASIAFEPRSRVVGLGAIGDFVDACARRLVLQETLVEEIASGIFGALSPRWVACKLSLTHGCMTARGGRRHAASVDAWFSCGDVQEEALSRLLGGGRS